MIRSRKSIESHKNIITANKSYTDIIHNAQTPKDRTLNLSLLALFQFEHRFGIGGAGMTEKECLIR
jgi:hypothetical protein